MKETPDPIHGYSIIIGSSIVGDVQPGTLMWHPGEECWKASGNIGNFAAERMWYGIPQKDPIGTDPKGEIGKTKAPMWLLPSTALIETAWAMDDGQKKYGPYNWRETRVCASTYISAMMRHWAAYLDGEDRAEDSKCHHLAHIAANCNILMDAAKCGTLVDDRPKMPCPNPTTKES